MTTWQRWRASKGYPWRDRLIFATPESWLLAVDALLKALAAHAGRVDQFCRRCAWRRKHYGLREFLRRTWNDED